MRMRPKEIDIPQDNLFVNDKLDRRTQVEAISATLAKMEGPCVLAIDAPWGEGKTTFLRMLQTQLRNNKFLVVNFNAWETDFCDDPFIALSAELIQQLKDTIQDNNQRPQWSNSLSSEIDATIGKLREQSVAVATWRLVKIMTQTIVQHKTGVDVSGIADILSGQHENIARSRIDNYDDQKRMMKEFKQTLESVGLATNETSNGPLIIIIDELDRCRPIYAIELLEAVKHLFSVDGVVFVLGLNRAELAHSVRAIYGEGFKAERYLSRFIDIDVNLPRPNTTLFVESLMRSCGVYGSLEDSSVKNRVNHYYSEVIRIVEEFLASSELSIRDIAQSIHHLGLVLVSLRPNRQPLMIMTVILLALRSIDRGLYSRFAQGEVDDAAVVDSLFARPGLKRFINTWKGAYIEVYIVLAYKEIRYGHDAQPGPSTPLTERYQGVLDESSSATDEERKHAKRIIDLINNETRLVDRGIDTQVVISRIEMFADSIAH